MSVARVLLVDADPSSLKLMEEMLRHCKYDGEIFFLLFFSDSSGCRGLEEDVFSLRLPGFVYYFISISILI